MRRTITAFFFYLSALILAACSRSGSEPGALLSEVELVSPQQVIEGGVHLDVPDQSWDGYGEVVEAQGNLLVVGASEWNQCGAGAAFVYRSSDGVWHEEARLVASDRQAFLNQARRFEAQRFGSSAAVDDGLIVIGAPGNTYPEGGGYKGAVYVFEDDEGTWVETARLTPGSPDANTAQTETNPAMCGRMTPSSFGSQVSLDGDTLAAGLDAGTQSIFVFQRDTAGWQEQARLPVPNSSGRDLYLAGMDLYGDTMVLSAFYTSPQAEQDTFLTGKVVVYVFERSGNTWQESFRFTPEEGEEDLLFLQGGNFGASVAVEGESEQASLLAIGLPGFPDLRGNQNEALWGIDAEIPEIPESRRKSGAVYVFERGEDGDWKPQVTLKPAGWEEPPGPSTLLSKLHPTPGDGQSSPEADGYLASVGLPESFVFPGDLLSANPEISFFGAKVDLDKNQLAVTAGYANVTYVFEHQGQGWVYRYRITPIPVSESVWEDYAQVVAISDCTLLLGTPGEFGDSAYVFDLCNP